MKILATIPIELSDEEVTRIGRSWLSSLKKGQWLEERSDKPGHPQKWVLREEHCTSHRFDTDADDQSIDRIKLVKTIQELEEMLRRIK